MNLEHKTHEAKARTLTDAGEFTAIAAAYTVDRVKERIVPGAFKSTIERWQASGKLIPLHWDHSGDAKDIIGTIDPASMAETAEGLEVKGKLDLDESEVAREAWRSMKANRVGLSFGYLVTESGSADDGITELKALDLFEISVTPAPANPDTRFVSLKSMKPAELRDEIKKLRKRLDEIEAAIEDEPPPAEDSDASDQGAESASSRQASDPEAVRIELERIDALAN